MRHTLRLQTNIMICMRHQGIYKLLEGYGSNENDVINSYLIWKKKSYSYQSPRTFFKMYYLSSAGCGYQSICVRPLDRSHTVQPTALKFWYIIPHVTF